MSGRVEQLGIVRSHIFISHIIAVIRGWPGQAGWQGMSAQASQQPHRPTKTAPEYFNVLWSTQNIHSNGNFRNVIILSTFSEEFPSLLGSVLCSARHAMGSLVCVIVDMLNGGSAPVTLPSLEAVSVLLINKLFCNNWTAFCSAGHWSVYC